MSCLCLAVVAGEWLYVPGEACLRNGFSLKTNQLAACGKAAPSRPSRGVGICSRGVRICSRGVRIWEFWLASPALPGRSGAVQRGRAGRLGGQRTAVRLSQVFHARRYSFAMKQSTRGHHDRKLSEYLLTKCC